jgi:hypothetical protein
LAARRVHAAGGDDSMTWPVRSCVMRRLARHLFTVCSAVSLLLCVAACVLWVWSQTHITSFVLSRQPDTRGERVWVIASAGGGLYLSAMQYPGWPYPAAPAGRWRDFRARGLDGNAFGVVEWDLVGFAYQKERPWGYSPGQPRAWRVPMWFIASLLAAPAGLWLVVGWLSRRRRRAALGLCPTCGYDLRVHAAGDRCPECGNAVAHAAPDAERA